MRFGIVVVIMAAFAAYAVSVSGCAHPYSGKSERLKKPRKKKRPEPTAEETADAEAQLDDKCRTNFFTDPTKRRKSRRARSLAKDADAILAEAEGTEGQTLITAVKDALSKLENALKADPYGPEPTYKMAVAYALVGKKGCAIALLERLQELTKHPDVAGEADRVINRALRDQSFDLFRKDADAAMGR